MTGFEDYLRAFHDERAGITEALLAGARNAEGHDPYGWLAEVVPAAGRVVDLACGSAPTAAHLAATRYLGVDRSAGELELARRRHPEHRFVEADAVTALRRDATGGAPISVIVTSFALQLLTPLDEVLAAIASALRSGGTLVATVPTGEGIGIRDRLRWGRLVVALRTRLRFPNDAALRDAEAALARHGLVLVEDRTDRFAVPLPDEAAARTLVDSLYLPDVAPSRAAAATRVAHAWVGSALGLGVRRLVARSGRTVTWDAERGLPTPGGTT